MSKCMPERLADRMPEYISHMYIQMVCPKLCQNNGSGWESVAKYIFFGFYTMNVSDPNTSTSSLLHNGSLRCCPRCLAVINGLSIVAFNRVAWKRK